MSTEWCTDVYLYNRPEYIRKKRREVNICKCLDGVSWHLCSAVYEVRAPLNVVGPQLTLNTYNGGCGRIMTRADAVISGAAASHLNIYRSKCLGGKTVSIQRGQAASKRRELTRTSRRPHSIWTQILTSWPSGVSISVCLSGNALKS